MAVKMNLQFFADGEEGGEDFSKYVTEDGGLDVETLMSDFQEENPENEDETHQENEETPPENEEETEEGQGGGEGQETPPEPAGEGEGEGEGEGGEETPPENEKRTPDAAFAEMRRRAEQNESLAKWVQDLATKQGFSDPNQLIEAFNKQQLAKEAQQKGVPVDVYQRLNELEQENKQKEEEMFKERFNTEVAMTKEKYNLSNEQINETFKFMAQKGYIDENGRTNIPFEDAYTLANKDTFIEQAKEQARQDYLKELEKKQQSAAPNPKTGAEDSSRKGDVDLSTEGIFDTLEKLDIDWQ